MYTRLEDIPNEVLLDILQYMDATDLYYGFWKLNQRFNQLLQSLKNLSLTIEKDESSLISLFGHQIVRIVIDTSLDVDFSQFPYLHSLIFYQMTRNHFQQIHSKFIPHLTSLSTLFDDKYFVAFHLNQRIFSQSLPSLHSVNLGSLYIPMSEQVQSYSLHSISVNCVKIGMVQSILVSAPNLAKLRVCFEEKKYNIFDQPPSVMNHPLKCFILADPYSFLCSNDINMLLQCIPNVQRIRLNFNCDVPFIHFIQILSDRLPYLNRFDCYIDELVNNVTTDIEIIHELKPCFTRIRFTTDDYGYRTYTTNSIPID